MRYYLDTEFIERPGSMQLISIGIAAEDGRTFYAENSAFDEREADQWVLNNVIDKLQWYNVRAPFHGFIDMDLKHYQIYGPPICIKDAILAFLGHDSNPEFWAYYADYDWVNFCWIFGKMIDLPPQFPKYCRDLKQLLDGSDKDKIPDPENEHNALEDALWNQKLHRHLTGDEW